MQLRYCTALILLFTIALGAVLTPAQNSDRIPAILQDGLDKIEGSNILDHVKMLASDEFEGRSPGTRGVSRG